MRASAVAGIIFANSHDDLLPSLTQRRSMASVPFGGRYRLIDFALSNMVNAGISNVGVITKEKYHSLMDHLGSGLFWDLDRKSGGLRILPPYSVSGTRRYHGYIEALMGAMGFIERSGADYLVISEADLVANIDLSAALDYHVDKNADVTIIYRNGISPEGFSYTSALELSEDGRVSKIFFPETKENVSHSLGIMIFSVPKLIKLITAAYNADYTSISRDILAKKVDTLLIYGFCHDGFSAVMDSEKTFFDANMQLLDSSVRNDLFFRERPIFTKTRDDMPTRYGTKSNVSNSFIADGCIIDGTVKNSILFRGVKVSKGAVIENSIVMQGTNVGENATLEYVITDKNSEVDDNMTVKGTKEKVFIISKKQIL